MIVCFADEVNKKDDDRTIRDKDVSARMQRRSGKIMVVRNDDDDNDDNDDSGDGDDNDDDNDGNDDDNDDDDDDDDDDFSDDNEELLSFELDEIKEKDADGNDVGKLERHSVDSFDNVDFDFSQVRSDSKFQGLSAINVNLSTYLDDPKANLDVMVYLFREAGTVRFGSETFAVQAGTVKFNIKVRNNQIIQTCFPMKLILDTFVISPRVVYLCWFSCNLSRSFLPMDPSRSVQFSLFFLIYSPLRW